MSGRKMYPNNTMRAELESRLRCLKEKGSSNRFMRKKAEDLEEMLATVDRSELEKSPEKRLLHLKKVSIAVPSSIVIKRKIAEAEKVLGVATDAATTKTEDVEAADFPAPDEDVEAAALLAPARALEAHQVDAGDDGAVRACNSPKPIFQKFNENILEDRKKLLNLVKSTLKKKDVIPKKADKIPATDGDTKAQESLSKEFMKPWELMKKFSIMTAPAIMATVQLLQMMIIMMLLLKVCQIEYRERNDFSCVDVINKVDLNAIALVELKEDIMTFLNGQVPCGNCEAIINRVQHNHPTSVKSNEDNVASLNGHIRQTLESVSSVPADADVDNEDEDEMQVDKVSDPPIQYNAEADPGKVNNLRVQHIAEAVLFIIIIATRGYFSPSSVQIQGRELSAALDDAVKKDPDPGKVSVRHKLKQKNDDNDVNKKVDDEKKETDNNAEKMQDDNVKQEEKEDTETEADEKKEDYLDDKAEEAKEIPNTNAKRKLEEIKESRMKENGCKLFRKFVIEI